MVRICLVQLIVEYYILYFIDSYAFGYLITNSYIIIDTIDRSIIITFSVQHRQHGISYIPQVQDSFLSCTSLFRVLTFFTRSINFILLSIANGF